MDEFKCSVCSNEGPFSKRQLKLAAERKTVRCTVCIDNKRTVDVPDATTMATTKSKNVKPDAAAAIDPPNAGENREKQSPAVAATSSNLTPPSPTSAPAARCLPDANDDPSVASSSNEAAGFSPMADAEEDDDEDDVGTTSLNALKHQIMGRRLRTMSDPEEDSEGDDDVETNVDLRKELACAICHDLLHQPVSLSCGHSFCHECVHWWMTHSRASSSSATTTSCPTCRASLPQVKKLGINTALRACVNKLFGAELKERRQLERERKRKATCGEQSGVHDRGYEELDRKSTRISLEGGTTKLSLQRSIRLDAEDQRMQLALALCGGGFNLTSFELVKRDNHEWSVQVVLALLTMEEDEVEDGGFPWMIGEDDDNDALVAKHVQHSFIEARARRSGSTTLNPLARRALKDGEVTFVLTKASLHKVEGLVFRDEKTGVELELLMPALGWNGIQEPKVGAAFANDKRHTTMSTMQSESDDEEQEGDYYDDEDDGFIVDEEDEEEEDDDDPCCMCRKGGDLMICDGGDLNEIEGCGRSFHVECVEREEVPPGDWVCEVCAMEHGMEGVGVKGHEFPDLGPDTEAAAAAVADKDGSGGTKKRVLDEEDSDEEAAPAHKKHKANDDNDNSKIDVKPPEPKKRMVILDDSSDDDDE
jgi:hypothetical protein